MKRQAGPISISDIINENLRDRTFPDWPEDDSEPSRRQCMYCHARVADSYYQRQRIDEAIINHAHDCLWRHAAWLQVFLVESLARQ